MSSGLFFYFLLKSLTLFFGKSSGVVEWRPDGGGGGPARLVVDYF